MKAAQSRAPASLETIEIVDLADAPAPGSGEIRVRLRASSLNYHDLSVVTSSTTADRRIPMSDGAGEVVAIGEGVAAFAVGDAVVSTFFPDWLDGEILDDGFRRTPGDGMDGYAREFVTCPERFFTRAPKGFSHAEAATLPCAGLTAWRALVVDGGLKAGDTVLVLGTGGVSVFAMQIAKAMGATVIATSSSDAKLARLEALGADHLINYRKEPQWGKRVRGLTADKGVDHVIEVGGADTLGESMTAVRAGGLVSVIGLLSGLPGSNGSIIQAIGRQLRLQGLIVGSRKHQLDFFRGIDAIGLKPVIDRRFPLAEIAEASRYQQSGGHFGKIVVEI